MEVSAAEVEEGGGHVIVGLDAVIVAVTNEEPRVLVVRRIEHELLGPPTEEAVVPGINLEALPFGPFLPKRHRTLAEGLRSWVEEQTDLKLGYVEQLYTFGDRGRDPRELAGGPRVVAVVYLALAREARPAGAGDAVWQNWYHYLPWEDWRDGKPAWLGTSLEPALARWADGAASKAERRDRRERVDITFGLGPSPWDEELVLDRYELLYEAGLVAEALRGRHPDPRGAGHAMVLDHRRILATAMGRLRGKIKYRPVVFDLMPETFTLLQLQRTVEALAGRPLHKQNFRRLVEKTGLVEGTGRMEGHTGGRPAEQFRFRRDVVLEHPSAGVKLPVRRRGA